MHGWCYFCSGHAEDSISSLNSRTPSTSVAKDKLKIKESMSWLVSAVPPSQYTACKAPHELAIKRVILAFASLRKTSYKNGNYLNKKHSLKRMKLPLFANFKSCTPYAQSLKDSAENCLFHGKKRIKLGKQSSRGQEAQFHVLQYTRPIVS